MYCEFFDFQEKPFNVTPDTRYLYLSPIHQSTLKVLQYGIEERKGFLLLTGEVGTGKTVSIRALLNNLKESCETSLILNPQLSRLELLKTINKDFGQELRSDSFKAQIDHLNEIALAWGRQGKNALVIIDEAQNLSPEALEMTRLLSNLETENFKLLQILLVGQPELIDKLSQKDLRQLRQRIQIHARLTPLDEPETERYVGYRIHKAGPKPCVAFEKSAITKIHQFSRGIPRLINTICDFSLMAAYSKSLRVITDKIVGLAFQETQGEIPYVHYS
ncbi:MAG: AAA family ATPase [Deltaproteobacteria bacterium]|nr:AAA family ATPase [Deltaproteobacteria bacterium]